MKTIAMIIMVSIVLEALVEYTKTIIHMLEEMEYKTAITQFITILLGIFLAKVFNTQLFNGALSEVYEGLAINPTIDIMLTGILFSRGSNYFSDLISRLTKREPHGLVDEECFDEDDDEDYDEDQTELLENALAEYEEEGDE